MTIKQRILIAAAHALFLMGSAGCIDSGQPPAPEVNNGATILENASCLDTAPATCPDAEMPSFLLTDFQPQSAQFEETYGLDDFRDKVTIVALLASW